MVAIKTIAHQARELQILKTLNNTQTCVPTDTRSPYTLTGETIPLRNRQLFRPASFAGVQPFSRARSVSTIACTAATACINFSGSRERTTRLVSGPVSDQNG